MGIFQGKLYLIFKGLRPTCNIRKGYTLIELVAAISISFTIIVSAAYFFNLLSRNYKLDTEGFKQHFYVNETFRFINMRLRDNVRKVQVANNVILLTRYKKIPTETKTIKFEELNFIDTEIIEIRFNLANIQHENLNTKRTDILLRDVKNFIVEKKSGYLYVNIEMKSGGAYEKCMDLRYIEN
jgi:hypothetical protein